MSETTDTLQRLRRILLVDGLPNSATEPIIWKHFSQYAALTSVRIVRDLYTGESKGYAYIILDDCDFVSHVLSFQHRLGPKIVSLHMPSRKGQRHVWKYDLLHRRIYVSGLPTGTHQNDLMNAFSPHGRVQLAHIISDPHSEKFETFGFVDFWRESDAVKALNQEIRIKGVLIKVANTKTPKKQPVLLDKTTNKDSKGFTPHSSGESKDTPAGLLGFYKNIGSEDQDLHQDKLEQTSLDKEVSNYQRLKLDPWIYVNVLGLIPLMFAYNATYFEIGLITPIAKSHVLSGDLKMLRLKQSAALLLPKPKPDTAPPKRQRKVQRIKDVLAHKIDQDISNYTFRLERPEVYLRRNISVFRPKRGSHNPRASSYWK